jgi:hypothetical protein
MEHRLDLRRSEVLRGALVGGGALLAGAGAVAGLTRLAGAAPSAEQDTRILNVLLGLEHVQLALYEEALDNGALSGDLLRFAQIARGHERVHVDTLQELLGANAESPPAFAFGGATTDPDAFADAAARIEDLTVDAFNGQVTNLTPRARAQSARVVSVDARHAAWVRTVVGREPASEAVDPGRPAAEVARALDGTGFVQGGTP